METPYAIIPTGRYRRIGTQQTAVCEQQHLETLIPYGPCDRCIKHAAGSVRVRYEDRCGVHPLDELYIEPGRFPTLFEAIED